jgi:4-carboxymuconolactone decarboxylase
MRGNGVLPVPSLSRDARGLYLALNDVLSSSIPMLSRVPSQVRGHGTGELEPKIRSLVRLAAYVALDASPKAYTLAVEAAVNSGASPFEMIGVLVAVAPAVGVARVVSAAPKLASAMGFDVDRAMEYLTTNGTEATGSP